MNRVEPRQVLDEAIRRKVHLVVQLSKGECLGADVPWDVGRLFTLIVCPTHKNVRLVQRSAERGRADQQELLFCDEKHQYSVRTFAPHTLESLRAVFTLLRKALVTKGRP